MVKRRKKKPNKNERRVEFRFKERPCEVIFKLNRAKKVRTVLRSMSQADTEDLAKKKYGFGSLGTVLSDKAVTSLQPLYDEDTEAVENVKDSGLRKLAMTVDEEDDASYSGYNLLRVETYEDGHRLCEMLCKDEKINYAHIAAEKYLATALDPLRNRQWGLNAIELCAAQSAPGFVPATDVSIGVIDTGVDLSHPDLSNQGIEERRFSGLTVRDTDGHGTHIVGIISAITNNQVGISGVSKSMKVVSMKALEPFSTSGYHRALRHAIRNDIRVLNLSLEGNADATERRRIRDAIRSGMVVVAAMGNRNSSTPSFPAAYPNVIAVGATDETDARYRRSNRGRHINLVAPGVRILSTVPTYPTRSAHGTDYDAAIGSGTSMAAAFVSSAAALVIAKKPNATLDEIRDALENGADFVPGQSGFTTRFGHGRLNIRGTLSLI